MTFRNLTSKYLIKFKLPLSTLFILRAEQSFYLHFFRKNLIIEKEWIPQCESHHFCKNKILNYMHVLRADFVVICWKYSFSSHIQRTISFWTVYKFQWIRHNNKIKRTMHKRTISKTAFMKTWCMKSVSYQSEISGIQRNQHNYVKWLKIQM